MIKGLKTSVALLCLLTSLPLAAQDLKISSIDAPAFADEGEKITFQVQVESTSEAELSYSWKFGDGKNPISGKAKSTVSHAYRDDGDYEISLTVSSPNGLSDTKTKSVSVKNVDPKIKPVNIPDQAKVGEPLRLHIIATDPGDDDLTYTWEFSDDDEKMEGEDLSKVTKRFREEGVHEIKITVKDEDGGSVTESYMVSIGVEYSMSASGAVGASNSGGAYFTYLNATPEGGAKKCFVAITLYNDNDRSLVRMFWTGESRFFGEKSNPPVVASLWWRLPDAAYFQFKAMGQQTNAVADPDFLDEYMAGFKRAPASIIKMGAEAGSQGFANMGRALKSIADKIPFRKKKKKEPTKPDPSMSATMEFESSNGSIRAKRPVGGRLKGTFSFGGTDVEGNVAMVSGKFNMDVTSLHQSYLDTGCEDELEEFAVVEVTPKDEGKNVKHKETEIVVEFSKPVNRETVDEGSIQLSYLDAEGDEIILPADYEYRGDNTVVLHPDVDSLKTGVIYWGNVLGGDYGIRGKDDEKLEDNFSWIFSTIVVPDSVVLDLYQVSRNAPLVTNKPTATRLYAYWVGDEEVDKDSQVTEFIANVDLPPWGSSQEIFKRQDQFSDQQKRRGEDSINLYNWRPSGRSLSSFEATIIPIDQEGEEMEFKANRDMDYFEIDGETLDVEYYMLRVGTWALMIPDERRAAAKLVANRSSLYTQQVFPISRNRVRDGGEISLFGKNADAEWEEFWAFLADNVNVFKNIPTGYRQDLLKGTRAYYFKALLHAFMSQVSSDADILVGFMPKSFLGGGTARYTDPLKVTEPLKPGEPNFHRRTTAMTPISYAYLTNALTHEYGHLFSLDHVPYAADANDRAIKCAAIGSKETWKGIEGMRMSKSGQFGWPKSSRFGNSESDSFLLPLMFPCAKLMEEAFIQDKQYIKLQDYMKQARGAGTWSWNQDQLLEESTGFGPFSEATWDHSRGTISGDLSYSISGVISNGGAEILPPVESKMELEDILLEGSNRIELLDEAGDLLYSGVFDSYQYLDSELRTFQVEIPWSHEVSGVRFSGRGLSRSFTKRIGKGIASELSVSCTNSGCDLSWINDYQGAETPLYSVFYRLDTKAPWRMIASLWLDKEISIESYRLPHGESPEFKLDTFVDGNTTSTQQAGSLEFAPLAVSFSWPIDGEEVDVRSEIVLGFNNQPKGETINLDNVFLKDSKGSEIGIYVFNEGDDQEIIVRPKEELTGSMSYTLTVKKEVTSRIGIPMEEDYVLSISTKELD